MLFVCGTLGPRKTEQGDDEIAKRVRTEVENMRGDTNCAMGILFEFCNIPEHQQRHRSKEFEKRLTKATEAVKRAEENIKVSSDVHEVSLFTWQIHVSTHVLQYRELNFRLHNLRTHPLREVTDHEVRQQTKTSTHRY